MHMHSFRNEHAARRYEAPPLPPEAERGSPVPESDWLEPPSPRLGGGKTTARTKLMDGLKGIKHAVRADSSFFAHAYRGLLIAISALILGVSPMGWCFLCVSAGLVLIAECAHSAVKTLGARVGSPGDPVIDAAREIAAAGVLAASITSAAITITVLVSKLDSLLGW